MILCDGCGCEIVSTGASSADRWPWCHKGSGYISCYNHSVKASVEGNSDPMHQARPIPEYKIVKRIMERYETQD